MNNTDNHSIRISIVTATYNAQNLIGQTIRNVFGQDYSDLEYIIVDGASEDGTLSEVNALIKEFPDRDIILKSEPDKGIYDAINKALKIASGDFLLVLGAGDTLFPNVLQQFVSMVTSPDTVYYGSVIWEETAKKYRGQFNRFSLARRNICHQAIFYPKVVYKHFDYELKYNVFADYAYNIKLFRRFNFQYIDIITIVYKLNGYSGTHPDKAFRKDKKKLILKHLGFLPLLYKLVQ